MKTDCLLYRILPVLCMLLNESKSIAQLPLPAQPVYVHYTSYNSGLPTELIYKIVADKNGYLWLATDKGLVRYNGKEFRLINTGRPEDFVSVLKTKENMLWLFAYSGHTIGIDLNTQKIINTDSLYGLNNLTTNFNPYLLGFQWGDSLLLHKQGRHEFTIIYPANKKSIIRNAPKFKASEEILNHYNIPEKIQSAHIKKDFDSMFYFHNSNGLCFRDSLVAIQNKIFICRNNTPAVLLFNGNEYGINDYITGFVRRENDLYLSALRGIGLCRIKGFFSLPKSRQIVDPILPDEQVTFIETDYLNNIWVSTYSNGLFLFPNTEANTLHYNKIKSGLYNEEVTMLQPLKEENIAVGYDNAVIDFYTHTGMYKRYKAPAKYEIQKIQHIECITGKWLMFTRSECFQSSLGKHTIFPDNFIKTPFKKDISGAEPGYKSGMMRNDTFYYASTNRILFIGPSGVINQFRPIKNIPAKKTCVLPAGGDHIYTGTTRGCYYDSTLLPYLKDVQINKLYVVNDKMLFGTNTGTYTIPLAAIYDSSQLRKINPDLCYSIKSDSNYTYFRGVEQVIIAENNTFKLISKFSFKKYAVPFSLNDFSIDNAYIGFAGNRGIFYIPKENIIHPIPVRTPQVHILCSLTDYSPADSAYKCRYDKTLSALFEIDILDYRNEEKEITYRLLKNGKEIYTQSGVKENTQINFQPLSPGKYQIEYHVRFGYNGAEKIVSFSLIIIPLWYQQWWLAPLLVLLALSALLYAAYKWNQRLTLQNHRKLKQELYLHELESQSLFGQLKPHFIFNILTPLQGYFIREEKIEGLNYLNNFSGLMRGILNSIRDKQTELKNEINFVSQYLQIQESRFNNCFSYNISLHLHRAPEQYIIPTLLLQPLVENAVEHGIIKTKKDGRIDIVIEETENTLSITVKDNGAGLPAGFRLKDNHALKIITERMLLLKKMKGTGQFKIFNTGDNEAGTTAILTFAKNIKI
jgi:hypothetical protein